MQAPICGATPVQAVAKVTQAGGVTPALPPHLAVQPASTTSATQILVPSPLLVSAAMSAEEGQAQSEPNALGPLETTQVILPSPLVVTAAMSAEEGQAQSEPNALGPLETTQVILPSPLVVTAATSSDEGQAQPALNAVGPPETLPLSSGRGNSPDDSMEQWGSGDAEGPAQQALLSEAEAATLVIEMEELKVQCCLHAWGCHAVSLLLSRRPWLRLVWQLAFACSSCAEGLISQCCMSGHCKTCLFQRKTSDR